MLTVSIVVLLVENTFHLQLYKVYHVPTVNTMLPNTLTMQLTNPSLVITDDKQHYTCSVDMDIMKFSYLKDIAALYQDAYIWYKEVQIILQPCALTSNHNVLLQ